ncbi:MAG: NDP-hexose 2,3-dehydratase family protein [Nitrospirae bacterium]|nr:NDP-hexose 2,3-dehydratase family protein [Nitrospirota bacterium]
MKRIIEEMRDAGIGKLSGEARIAMKIEQYSSWFHGYEDADMLKEIAQWLDDERARNHIAVNMVSLRSLTEWHFDKSGFFSHKSMKFFKIVGLKVTSPVREVSFWSQPIMENEGTGIIGLLVRRTGGKTFFLMQAKADAGNRNLVQIGPTVQFNPGNYIDNERLKKPFLFDEFRKPHYLVPAHESRQAEEGGRYYKEDHTHRILMLPDGMTIDHPPGYRWFSYPELRFFLHMGDIVNSSARSILACLV